MEMFAFNIFYVLAGIFVCLDICYYPKSVGTIPSIGHVCLLPRSNDDATNVLMDNVSSLGDWNPLSGAQIFVGFYQILIKLLTKPNDIFFD